MWPNSVWVAANLAELAGNRLNAQIQQNNSPSLSALTLNPVLPSRKVWHTCKLEQVLIKLKVCRVGLKQGISILPDVELGVRSEDSGPVQYLNPPTN